MKFSLSVKDLVSKSLVNRIKASPEIAAELEKIVDDTFQVGEIIANAEGSVEEVITFAKEMTEQIKIALPSLDKLVDKGFAFAAKKLESGNEALKEKLSDAEAEITKLNEELYNLKNPRSFEAPEIQ